MTIQSNNNQRVNKYYVYAHYTEKGNLFYIGVGTILNFKSKKQTQIYSRAHHFSNRNKFWKSIANKYGVKVKILFEYPTKEESLNKERELVEQYGRRCMKQGILTNISLGGEIGPIGRIFKMSEKQKKLLSDKKAIHLYVYNSNGEFLKKIKTIKTTANYCGVTYNAIHSCLKTKNYSNGYFIFKEYKGLSLGYTIKDVNFKHTLSKKVITEDLQGMQVEHESIWDCCQYLKTDRKNLKSAIKLGRLCKKHKVYFKDNQQPSP